MNAQIIFSDAPYQNKHSLKISHPYIQKRVFYRPESSFGISPFEKFSPIKIQRDHLSILLNGSNQLQNRHNKKVKISCRPVGKHLSVT